MRLQQPLQALAGGGGGRGQGAGVGAVPRPALRSVTNKKKRRANRSSIYPQEVSIFVEGMRVLLGERALQTDRTRQCAHICNTLFCLPA